MALSSHLLNHSSPLKPLPGPLIVSPSKYPQRNRKRNRFFYNDDEESSFETQRGGKKRASRNSPSKQDPVSKSGLDRKAAQRVGLSLRTLLKLPKAHKWVCYEWFYANIDQSLFLGENDFQQCLSSSFPQLKTRMLKKVEWAQIRKLMGKPRRCSTAFFAEERAALHAKRNKIRHLQQNKVVDISQFRDLPENIPLPLVIGTRVTALLRHPSDGLFTGTIDAVDTADGSYRITFDRTGIGSHPIPDYEVQSIDQPEFLPLTSFQSKSRPRLPFVSAPKFMEIIGSQVSQLDSESLAPATPSKSTNSQNDESNLGGFPIKFLAVLVRLSKILAVKKKKIYELRSMNAEAEKYRSLRETIPHEFKKQYAGTILELDRLNSDLDDYLKAVNQYSLNMSPEHGLAQIQPEFMKHKFSLEAKEIAERSLASTTVRNERSIDIVTQLVSLMLHMKSFSETEVSSFELKSLNEALEDTQKKLNPSNLVHFQNEVEVHVNHIQSSLSHLGNLGVFAESSLVEGSTT